MSATSPKEIEEAMKRVKDIKFMNECYQCKHWEYNERIANKYGEGTGYCKVMHESKGCNRKACMVFIERNNDDEM